MILKEYAGYLDIVDEPEEDKDTKEKKSSKKNDSSKKKDTQKN